MQDDRTIFRDFLLRLANNILRADDWDSFATRHYSDEDVERLRQVIVKRSLDFSDWQIGSIDTLVFIIIIMFVVLLCLR